MGIINDVMKFMGAKGGNKTKKNQDPEYYKRLGKIGAKARWDKVRANKEAEKKED